MDGESDPQRNRIPTERIYLDKKSGATTERPGLSTLLDYARPVT